MNFPRYLKTGLTVIVVTFMLLFVFSGCTPRPSPEQLTKLEETRKAAAEAEQKLSELKGERTQLEDTLNEKKSELKKRQEEQEAIKAKLAEEGN
ncbi:MAG: hypothetical protein ABIA63_02685 [bacterium]